jgi:hypothetical protein
MEDVDTILKLVHPYIWKDVFKQLDGVRYISRPILNRIIKYYKIALTSGHVAEIFR